MLELTRAANYVCDALRRDVYSGYRLSEGAVLAYSGPYIVDGDFVFRAHRLEYKDSERTSIPYPGLDNFKEVRSNSTAFGAGKDENDPAFLECLESGWG